MSTYTAPSARRSHKALLRLFNCAETGAPSGARPKRDDRTVVGLRAGVGNSHAVGERDPTESCVPERERGVDRRSGRGIEHLEEAGGVSGVNDSVAFGHRAAAP